MAKKGKGYWRSFWRRINNNSPKRNISVGQTTQVAIPVPTCSSSGTNNISSQILISLFWLIIIIYFPGIAWIIIRPIPEFLPVGQWPRQQNGQGGKKKANLPGEFPIQARESFLKSLKPSKVIDGISFKRKYNYRAFVFFEKKDGRVVIENIGYGNAAYCFKLDEFYVWLQQAEKEKNYFRNKSAPRPFVEKIVHNGDWQTKIIDFLTRPRV